MQNISIEYRLCGKTIVFSSTLWQDESLYKYNLHPNQLKVLIETVLPQQTIPIVWFGEDGVGVSIDKELIIKKYWVCDNA